MNHDTVGDMWESWHDLKEASHEGILKIGWMEVLPVIHGF
jgi:hypothetical protein